MMNNDPRYFVYIFCIYIYIYTQFEQRFVGTFHIHVYPPAKYLERQLAAVSVIRRYRGLAARREF